MFEKNSFFDATSSASDLLILGVVLLLLVLVNHVLRPSRRRRSWRPAHIWRPTAARAPGQPGVVLKPDMTYPSAQMDAIARVQFECVPLLNREEARLLPVIEGAVRDFGKGHRLMAQTSLGEILRPREASGTAEQRRDAFAAINSKRFDFAIFDRFGILVAAIEYQGSGHYGSEYTYMRDAIKCEVLRKAGVRYEPIAPDFDANEVRSRIQKILIPPPRS